MRYLRQLALAFTLALLACAPAWADPALWVAKSSTATVYLFGTVHILPAGTKWHYPTLDKALAASGKLYVEENDDSPLAMQMLVLKYGVDLQHPLSQQLDAADRTRLDAAAKDAGLPGGSATLDKMRPWLAALTISVAPLLKAGYDPKSGVDKQLQRQFKAADKPIGAFETAEVQIKLFANLSPALQLDLLHNALDDYAKGPDEIKKIIRAWQAGDVATIAKTVNGGMRKHYPELYSVLLVNRNRNWAQQIDGLLQEHGTFFVAVGTGHLTGPDRVQVQLQKLGIRTERVH